MHDLDLILTLTLGMAAALALGFVTHKFGLSPIVGYLLAGIVLGSHTPGFEVDPAMAEQVAHIGVILLMFGVGLQFHLHELLAVRKIAIPGAIVQIAAATLLGAVVGWFAWHSLVAGFVFGLCISVASTVVLLRVLADNNALHTSTGHTAVGWLVVEDIFTVIALVLLPALFGHAANLGHTPGALGEQAIAEQAPAAFGWVLCQALVWALVKIGALVAIVFVVGGRVIPWILKKIAAANSRELFTLAVLVIALGIAVGSNVWFDVSMELGAFLAGMIVARSQFSFRAASEALPMRDAFAVLFFVSVGMLLDPLAAIQSPGLLLATLGIVLVGKPLAAFAIVTLLRYPVRVAIGVSIALAQIGEFSFILAEQARALDILTDEATNTLIAAAIVSISINPLLYKLAGPLERWALSLRAGKGVDVDSEEAQCAREEALADPRDRAVVVGYGPVGQTVTRLLRENDLAPTVIDLNVATVESLNNDGTRAVYGDATQREILVGAGVAKARTLILSAPKIEGTTEIIRLARELNPAIRVLARTTYLSENEELRRSGADEVFSGEGELALAFTEAVLEDLGATPEQIDRERDRVHEELFVRAQAESR